MEMVIWFISVLIWEELAPKAPSIVRNLIALAMPVLFILAFLILYGSEFDRMFPVMLVIWCVVAGTFVLAEKFPKNPENLAMRRENMTFLQDGLFVVHSLMICVLFLK